jgi:hypothetical protein
MTDPDKMTSVPGTGRGPDPRQGRVQLPDYYFIKVKNESRRRIRVTCARFTGAPDDELHTWQDLPAWVAPEDRWEGWLNAARLGDDEAKVFRSGRVRIDGIKRPIKSRRNTEVATSGPVDTPTQ